MEVVNTPISKLCYVTVETIWKNTVLFVDGRMDLKEIGVNE
jgi:hypothetical protein